MHVLGSFLSDHEGAYTIGTTMAESAFLKQYALPPLSPRFSLRLMNNIIAVDPTMFVLLPS